MRRAAGNSLFVLIALFSTLVPSAFAGSLRIEAVGIDWRAEVFAAISVAEFDRTTAGQHATLISDAAAVQSLLELLSPGVCDAHPRHGPDVRYRFDLYENSRRIHTVHLSHSGIAIIDGRKAVQCDAAPVSILLGAYEKQARRLPPRVWRDPPTTNQPRSANTAGWAVVVLIGLGVLLLAFRQLKARRDRTKHSA